MVKVLLCLNNDEIKTHRGLAVNLQPVLRSRLDGEVNCKLQPFYHWKSSPPPRILGIGDWMGTKFCLKRVAKKKNPFFPGMDHFSSSRG
jgi:hypothetical protein